MLPVSPRCAMWLLWGTYKQWRQGHPRITRCLTKSDTFPLQTLRFFNICSASWCWIPFNWIPVILDCFARGVSTDLWCNVHLRWHTTHANGVKLNEESESVFWLSPVGISQTGTGSKLTTGFCTQPYFWRGPVKDRNIKKTAKREQSQYKNSSVVGKKWQWS